MPKPLIALYLVNEDNDYQRSLRDDAVAAAERQGFALEVQSARNDFVEQVRQIHDAVHRPVESRPQFLLVFPVRDASLEHVFRSALRSGIGCVILNRRPEYLQALQREFPLVPAAAVGPSQTEAGRLQGRQLRALLPGGGFVLQVHGPILSSATEDRQRGLAEELRGLRIETSFVYGDWRTDLAQAAVGNWLRLVMLSGLRLDAVAAQNDAMAVGARKALEATAVSMNRPELSRVPVLGIDGQPNSGQKMVTTGVLTATVIQPSSGGAAVAWVAEHLRGGRPEKDRVLPLTAYPEPGRLKPSEPPRPV